MENGKMKTACSTELGIDIETFSSVDIKNGAYAYSESPDFEVLLIGYKFSDEDEVHCIDLTEADPGAHERFWTALEDPEIVKTAYNANFERTCLARHVGRPMPPEQWRCTMILASQLGLPRSLADVGMALGLPKEDLKLKTGAALIQYFCKPVRPTKANGGRCRNFPQHAPDKWKLFKEYNMQDVHTEQTILQLLKGKRPDKKEQQLWTLDQVINDRGVLLDIDMAEKVVAFTERHRAELVAEAQRLSGLMNPNSRDQLLDWLARKGVDTGGLTKTDVEELLLSDIPDDVRRVLEIRRSVSKTSVNKYQTMLEVASEDGRARGIMQFYGGHTGRWAGRSLQPQNLTRNTMPDDQLDGARALVKANDFEALEMVFEDPADVLSQLVRTAFIPSPGNRFVVTDFSAIEARVVAWVAGEEWRLDVFRKGGDIYCESASRIYHKPVVKHGINGELRQRGKVAELALGYGGGVNAMKAMDSSHSVPEEEMDGIVRQWRAESPKIAALWRACQDTAVAVINGEASMKRLKAFRDLTFKMSRVANTNVLRIYLPNGRPISYWDPQVADGDMGPRISYMTQNQTTRKWERTETWGGKLTENIVQSIARDCLAEKMLQLEGMGYKIVFHVHDEMILDVPRTDKAAAEYIDRVMAETIDWAPELPLQGGTYECDFYRKD